MNKKHQGLHPYRYKDNPLEYAFARQWAKTYKHGGTLNYLLSPTNRGDEPVSDRDRLVANTVIQWLGSPVGQQFLRDVFRSKSGRDFVKKWL